MFGHEKFEAYQISIKFVEVALRLVDNLPSGNSSLKDQLRRAMLSIPLNIAEGSGKMHDGDKKRYYSIARGSAMECAAICDVISLMEGNLREQTSQAKVYLNSIVGILTRVCGL